MKNWNIGVRITAGFGAVLLLAATLGVFAYIQVLTIDKDALVLTSDALPGVDVLGRVHTTINRSLGLALEHVTAPDSAEKARLEEELRTARKQNSDRLVDYGKDSVAATERPLFDALMTARKPYWDCIDEVMRLSRESKTKEAIETVNTRLKPLYKTYIEATDIELAYNDKSADDASKAITNAGSRAKTGVVVCLVAVVLLGIVIALLITRSITRPLAVTVAALDQMATGDVRVDPALKSLSQKSTDEIGRLATSVCSLAENTTEQAHAAQRIATGDLTVEVRVRSEQDVLGKSMTEVVDTLRQLVAEAGRLTEAAVAGKLSTRGDVQAFQGGYQQIVAGVNSTLDAVIGPLNVAAEYVRRISVGDLPPRITDAYNGDFDAIKRNLNTCLESLSTLIEQMNRMSNSHDAGDIDARIEENKFQGAYQRMAAGVNGMVNGHIALNRKAMACVAEFGRGSFDAPLEKFPGKKAFINEVVEEVRGNLKSFDREITSLVDAAVEGRLTTRASTAQFAGGWQALAAGVNRVLDAVIAPVADASCVIEKIAERDLTVRVKGEYRGDHAVIKDNINKMADYLAESMKKIAQSATTLSSAAEEFNVISQQMAGNAEETSAQAQVVQRASDEVTKNVAVAANGTAGMQTQIRNISKNATESAKVAQHAVGAAETANQSIARLEQSSVAIGNFVKVIASIAAQTNLLALNASIEAARAGEAGKGFSVVANEVKELAKGTANATSDISRQIDAIQHDTKEASVAIVEVAGIIKTIDEISRQVAASVEEQTLTTNDISRNVEHAAKSTSEIARNISGVAEAAHDTSQGSSQSQTAAHELTRVASQMQELVSAFRL